MGKEATSVYSPDTDVLSILFFACEYGGAVDFSFGQLLRAFTPVISNNY